LFGLAVFMSGACHAVKPTAEAEYRYWDWGQTPRRDDYQFAALKLALQKTVAAHGPFSLIRVTESYSTSRIHREIHSGGYINVHAAPWRDQKDSDPRERNIRIDVPILGNLLGYRHLIIRKEDSARFARIGTEADLKRQVAGLGRGWVDAQVFRHNGYAVDDHANLTTLIDMLASRRFDYLPMSVIEAESILAQYPQYRGQLAIAKGLVIYYALPTVFYVSASEPRLAQRLKAGLEAASKDGSLDKLTRRHFTAEIAKLRRETKRSFILHNPRLPSELSTAAPDYLQK
jgi:hypothetical protein